MNIKQWVGCFLWVFVSIITNGQANNTAIVINDDFQETQLNYQVSYFLDSLSAYTAPQIKAHPAFFKPVTSTYIYFRPTDAACWLRFEVLNTSDRKQSLAILTEGHDSLQVYLFKNDSLLQTHFDGTHIPPSRRSFSLFKQGMAFDLQPIKQSYTVFLRIKQFNTPLSVYPFLLVKKNALQVYLKKMELFRSLYVGGMTMIILFALYMIILSSGWLYVYYLVCASCSLSIMLVYNDFHYLFFEQCPEIVRNKNFFAVLIATLTTSYLLFIRSYIKPVYRPNKWLYLLVFVAVALGLLVILTVVVAAEQTPRFFFLFNIAGSLDLSLSCLFVVKAIQRKYKPAWLLVVATLPVFVVGIAEIFGEWHHIPIQMMHNVYYAVTLFEMCFLLLGLAWRFQIAQNDRLVANKKL
jgi:hypothetical protein